MVLPGLAEADVGEADRAPGEERRETRNSQKPVKHSAAVRSKTDVRDRAEEDDKEHRGEGTAGAVDVGEDLGRVALLGEGCEGSGAAVYARHANYRTRVSFCSRLCRSFGKLTAQNTDENDDVHEGIVSGKTGVLANEDERRGLCIGVCTLRQQSRVIGANKKANHEQTWYECKHLKNNEDTGPADVLLTNNVEKGDAPEDLLDGTRKRLHGIPRLSRS